MLTLQSAARRASFLALLGIVSIGCSSAAFDVAGDDDSGGVHDGPDSGGDPPGDGDAQAAHDDLGSDVDAAGDIAREIGETRDAGTDAHEETTSTKDAVSTDASIATFIFPRSTDVRSLAEDPYLFQASDYVQGSRTTSLASVHRLTGSFVFDNTLTGGSLSLDVVVNGTLVGKIGPITSSSTSPATFDLSFAPISGPTFVVRYQGDPAPDRLGTVGVVFDASPLTLEGSP